MGMEWEKNMNKKNSSNFVVSLLSLIFSLIGLLIIKIASFFSGFFSSISTKHKDDNQQNKKNHSLTSQSTTFEVVGESHYRTNLKKLAGKHGDESINKECIATLIPENDNQYDKNAIRIDIEGLTVGYLSRHDAILFRELLKANNESDQITTCKAVITGGFKLENNKRADYGVFLSM